MKSSKKREEALRAAGPGVTKVRYRERYARTVTEVDVPASGLADSGARSVSATGGLFEPKPQDLARFDLIPYECLARAYDAPCMPLVQARKPLYFYLAGDRSDDFAAIVLSSALRACGSLDEGVRRLAVLYGRGAIKYAERNWEKGIDTHQRVASLQRHFIKALRGDIDEDHIAAIAWNICACMFYETRVRDGRMSKDIDTFGLAQEVTK